MNKTDTLIMEVGTTGNHQVWFTRPEIMKFKELLIAECVSICKNTSHNECFTGHEFLLVASKIEETFGEK